MIWSTSGSTSRLRQLALQWGRRFVYCWRVGAQATIAGGGVIPHIHKSLINKTQKKEII